MKDVMARITGAIRSRTKEEWQQYFADIVNRLREFVRSEGEKAALVGFCLGIFIVIFHKLAVVLACFGIVAYQLVLIISDRSKD